VCIAAAGLCVPQMAMAAIPQNGKAPGVYDVRLHESGALLGQVVSPESQPLAGVPVKLRTSGKELAGATSDKNGYFAFAGLANGVYEIVTPEGRGVYRVWSHAAAPPSAQPGALVVNGDDTVVRGQQAMRGFRDLMANPWFVAAVITAAVAIPVAVHNGRGSKSN